MRFSYRLVSYPEPIIQDGIIQNAAAIRLYFKCYHHRNYLARRGAYICSEILNQTPSYQAPVPSKPAESKQVNEQLLQLKGELAYLRTKLLPRDKQEREAKQGQGISTAIDRS